MWIPALEIRCEQIPDPRVHGPVRGSEFCVVDLEEGFQVIADNFLEIVGGRTGPVVACRPAGLHGHGMEARGKA